MDLRGLRSVNMKKGPPFISIIIPVFNNAQGLERTLTAISKQIYPCDRFETIVIDNGSDDSPKLISDRFEAIYIEEHKHLGSPYSARNRGLEIAKGEIIALLDTTCTPIDVWLAQGVRFYA